MRLKSMTNFVLGVLNRDFPYNEVKMLTEISNYATFLKQPLKLGMFVPCDEDGNVLSEPKELDKYCKAEKCNCGNDGEYERDCSFIEYKKAKERVLFEGFYIHHTFLFYPNGVPFCNISGGETLDWTNIEWLLNNSFQDLQLTPTAIKQIKP